jgi:uncharacterized membrane protein YbhN (UPF0104 family)
LRMLACLALSLATQLMTVGAFLVVADVFPPAGLSPADYLFAVPLTLVVNMVPLTPGGVGIGEGAFEAMCRLLTGINGSYGTVFLAFRVVSWLAMAIIGLTALAARPLGSTPPMPVAHDR